MSAASSAPASGPTSGPAPTSAQASASASAQAPGVAELEAQEVRLTLRQFTYDDAWTLGCLLVELARERNAPVAIDIRRGPQQLFHCALPGSSADNDAWIDRKRRVVERYGASSLLVGTRFRAKGTTFENSSRLDPDFYAAHGGSFPLAVEGAGIIGTVTVSGLPQAEDHALVVEALERLRG
ncbi:heme-degrading domain-containing protein [Streptomyces sp. NPDC001840]